MLALKSSNTSSRMTPKHLFLFFLIFISSITLEAHQNANLYLDVSGSVSGKALNRNYNSMDKIKEEIKDFAPLYLSSNDSIKLILFTDKILSESIITKNQLELLPQILSTIKPQKGNTNIIEVLGNIPNKKDLNVLISDGLNNVNPKNLDYILFLDSLLALSPNNLYMLHLDAQDDNAITQKFSSKNRLITTLRDIKINEGTEETKIVNNDNPPSIIQIDNTEIEEITANDKTDGWRIAFWIILGILLLLLIIWCVMKFAGIKNILSPMAMSKVANTSLKTPLQDVKKSSEDIKFKTTSSSKPVYSEKVKAKPFVGENYGKSGRTRVMMLGESHYCENPDDFNSEITKDVIEDLYDEESEHEGYKNTYAKAINAIAGKKLGSPQEKREWWNKLSFYNFVQSPMTGPRIAPTPEQLKDASDAFFNVLEVNKPTHLLCWGYRLFDNYLPEGGRLLNPIRMSDGSLIQVKEYILPSGHSVKIMRMKHPSTGFSTDYWYEANEKFLKY